MPELLLELFSEEIPARMQAQAAADLKKLVTDALVARGVLYEGAAAFATPRRLALHIAGLPARQPDTREERKGPRVGSPEQALQGFLKSAGLASIDQAKVEKDPKGKGEFYVAVIERAGKPTLDVLAEILPPIIKSFPWPKSMRWGAASARSDSLRWVRPLHSIIATFGPETEEPEIVPFEVDGIVAGKTTRGHRFMAPGEISVRRFDDYVPALEKAKVVLDPARRRDIILHDARDLAFASGLELVEDEGLLDEVAGLVEWPVALMGEFDEAFLDIPAEVIRATIRANQKCFVLRKPDGKLANKFILVSNIVATDGGKAIAAGNGRVVRARLSAALYFWRTDQKPLPDYADKGKLLDQRMAKLRALNIVFHEKLGTQGERVERITALARELAPLVGANADDAARAAELCKADLMTEVVGEFPETQGLMGRRYAELQGEKPDVCVAIEDHYKPQGPSDRIPTNPVAIAVALADKIDTLVGFWAIDEKPTGSKDPYALRRAALGVIRILLENRIRVSLQKTIIIQALAGSTANAAELSYLIDDESGYYFNSQAAIDFPKKHYAMPFLNFDNLYDTTHASLFKYIETLKNDRVSLISGQAPSGIGSIALLMDDTLKAFFLSSEKETLNRDALADATEEMWRVKRLLSRIVQLRDFANEQEHSFEAASFAEHWSALDQLPDIKSYANYLSTDLLTFFIDRLKVYLRDKGARHDLIDAAIGDNVDDLLLITRRVDALAKFLDTDDGKNLLAGYKRAANILRAEEKKEKDGGKAFLEPHAPSLRSQPEESRLALEIERAAKNAKKHVADEDFEGAMRALSHLREPVDQFFAAVTVNDADAARRLNRLRILNELRAAMHVVADFSKIAG